MNTQSFSNYDFPDEVKKETFDKFNGEGTDFSLGSEHPLIFDFTYARLAEGCRFSFASPSLSATDYVDLMQFLKNASRLTYSQLENNEVWHFHEVHEDKLKPFNILMETKQEIGAKINKRWNTIRLPQIWQVAIKTTDFGAPRILGFQNSHGRFHALYLDLNHIIYKRK